MRQKTSEFVAKHLVALSVATVATVLLATLWCFHNPDRFEKDRASDFYARRGTFGDMFGAANALFSALTVIGVAYGITIQRRELQQAKLDAEEQKKHFENQLNIASSAFAASERSANAAVKSSEIAELSARASQRAYVGFVKIVRKSIKSPKTNPSLREQYIELNPIFTNVGKTPAHNVHFEIRSQHFPSSQDINIDWSDATNYNAPMSLAPSQSGATDSYRVSLEDIHKVYANQVAIVISSRVSYTDVFEVARVTMATLELVVSDDPANFSAPNDLIGLLKFRAVGNDANYAT